jgi:hypothetical protein
VPSDAQGEYAVQVTFDTGPLGGKLVGRSAMTVAAK